MCQQPQLVFFSASQSRDWHLIVRRKKTNQPFWSTPMTQHPTSYCLHQDSAGIYIKRKPKNLISQLFDVRFQFTRKDNNNGIGTLLTNSSKTMKKKQENSQTNDEHELEIIKAVAQAWHGHSTSSKPSDSSEFDTRRLNFKPNPSRFKLEAINKLSSVNNDGSVGGSWDFGQSLWDSYEIVTLSKRLEEGMVLDHQFPDEVSGSYGKSRSSRKLESKNSLRNIFNRASSKRFDDT